MNKPSSPCGPIVDLSKPQAPNWPVDQRYRESEIGVRVSTAFPQGITDPFDFPGKIGQKL